RHACNGNAAIGNSIDTALTLAPVWAATRLISDTIAALPLQACREVNGIKTPITTPPLLATPTIFGGPYEWVQRALTSLLLRGNAYGLITSTDMNGWPRQLEWLHPDEVTLKDNRAISRPEWMWNGRRVEPWLGRDSTGNLLHIPWFVIPGEILGLSPIRAFATTIETGILSQRFGRNFFGADAIPSAVLETDQPVNQEQATTIKTRFKQAASGRDPVVLGAGTKYRPITVPPEESQFLLTIKATATTVASIYGVRPERIGGETGNSMTYANVEQQSIADLHDMRPYLTKIEEHFTGLLPRPQFAKFNLDALLRSDTKSRYETHAIALDKKFKTVSEIREHEDLPPLTAAQRAEISEAQPKPAAVPDPGSESGNVIKLPRAADE
ncbi:MAG TPA: phage portal protein, partial [Vicinamibacterales bacterium]|nr:phage portal protein [Vicinamibacterales bacterium]